MEKSREEVVRGLKALAEFLEQNDRIPVPYSIDVNVFVEDKDALADVARSGGRWDKNQSDSFFWLRQDFGGGVNIQVNVNRERVCKRIVTGKKTIPARPEIEVDVVEWVCDEPLLAEG